MSDNFTPVQAQKFRLSGSGVTSSDTDIVLQSMTLPDGTTTIAMTDLGDIGFMTLEPGTSREEQISFTGITQNGDGTATLTGCLRGLRFVDPFDEVAANKKAHAGGTIAVLSNTAAFYGQLTAKDNDETITGIHTFTEPNVPRMSATHTYGVGEELYLATKAYVDSVGSSGAANASTTAKGIVEEATQAEVEAGTAAGATGARLFMGPQNYGAKFFLGYAADAGSNDTYAITLTPVPTAYATGQLVLFKANTANTGACTLNVNSLGAKSLKLGGSDPHNSFITANSYVLALYDGTNFEVIECTSDSAVATSTANRIVRTNSSGKIDSSFVTPADVQVFTSNGTWTMPTGATLLQVYCYGGGGSGGGGTNSGGNAYAGSGGGGGACVVRTFRASEITSPVTVTVAAQVAGGAAGTQGNPGNYSTFGSYLKAFGGGAGYGGISASAVSGGSGGGSNSTGLTGQSNADTVGGMPVSAAPLTGYAASGFGGGGTIKGGAGMDAESGGGGGGGRGNCTGGGSLFGGGGGGGGNTAGQPSGPGGGTGVGFTGGGSTVTDNIGNAGTAGDGIRAGAGGSGGSGATRNGGAGAAPSGGGGGGGSDTTGSVTSVGGVGARGEVRVYTWF